MSELGRIREYNGHLWNFYNYNQYPDLTVWDGVSMANELKLAGVEMDEYGAITDKRYTEADAPEGYYVLPRDGAWEWVSYNDHVKNGPYETEDAAIEAAWDNFRTC